MQTTPRTYRLGHALLALLLVLMVAGPLLAQICMPGAAHVAMVGAAPMTEAAHPCSEDYSAGHPGIPSDEAPADDVCCVVAPAVPAESAAVAAPPAPRVKGALFAVITAIWSEATEAPLVGPALAEIAQPPLPVRSHLMLSILLI